MVLIISLLSNPLWADFSFDRYADCSESIEELGKGQVAVLKGILDDDGLLAVQFDDNDGYFAVFRKRDNDLFCSFDEDHNAKVLEYELLDDGDDAGNLIYDHKDGVLLESSFYLDVENKKVSKKVQLDCFHLAPNSEMKNILKEQIENDVYNKLSRVVRHKGYLPRGSQESIDNIKNGSCDALMLDNGNLRGIIEQIKSL